MNLATTDTQFDDVWEALEFAFSNADKSTVKIASTQAGSNGTNDEIPTVWDKIAYSSLILKSLYRCSIQDRYAIELHLSRSEEVVEDRAEWLGVRAARDLKTPKWFTIDVCRDWSRHGRMKKNYRDWEINLGLGRTQIHTIAKSKKDTSIMNYLDFWEKKGLGEAEIDLFERGLIKKPCN